MRNDALDYDMPWRPNYEKYAAASWLGAGGIAMATNYLSAMPPEPFYWMGGICAAMTLSRLPAAIRLGNLQKNLKGRPLEFIKLEELMVQMKKRKDLQSNLWLGSGFYWENRHVQRIFEIMKRDWSQIVNSDPSVMGASWIHGVEPKEQRLIQPLEHGEGHTLIAGTTGSGKTRMS